MEFRRLVLVSSFYYLVRAIVWLLEGLMDSIMPNQDMGACFEGLVDIGHSLWVTSDCSGGNLSHGRLELCHVVGRDFQNVWM